MPRVVVYLRFARPRDGIADPPLVHWTPEKERELWQLLRASSSELDWPALAKRFDVSLVYILQQAAWLYEKELGLLRHKMSQINLPPAPATPARGAAPPYRRTSASHASTPAARTRASPRYSTAHDASLAESLANSSAMAATVRSRGPALVARSRSHTPGASLNTTAEDLDDSLSDATPVPSRRLLSASRILPSTLDTDSGSDTDSSLDAFLPAARAASEHDSRELEMSSSFSDNSVSQSALEEALLEQGENLPSDTPASFAGSMQSTL